MRVVLGVRRQLPGKIVASPTNFVWRSAVEVLFRSDEEFRASGTGWRGRESRRSRKPTERRARAWKDSMFSKTSKLPSHRMRAHECDSNVGPLICLRLRRPARRLGRGRWWDHAHVREDALGFLSDAPLARPGTVSYTAHFCMSRRRGSARFRMALAEEAARRTLEAAPRARLGAARMLLVRLATVHRWRYPVTGHSWLWGWRRICFGRRHLR